MYWWKYKGSDISSESMFSAQTIRKNFPIFTQQQSLVYLDSTATALKPLSVITKENEYYTQYSANIHRGIYAISEKATAEYEKAREKVAAFINAAADEIVFTRNTSESLNLVMYALSRTNLQGKEIVTTILEHHSNLVPWQELCRGLKIPLHICDLTSDFLLDEKMLSSFVSGKTVLVTLSAVSNVLGTIVPIKKIVQMVKAQSPSCLVLVDAAQAVPHMSVDVQDWGADLVAFSSHKMLGPTGIGVLWGKKEVLETMSPFLYGGDMISEVHRDNAVYVPAPHKFEAGTPHIAGGIALGAAIDYLQEIGMDDIRAHEMEITTYALKQLKTITGLTVFGPSDINSKGGVIAFQMQGIHPHDIAQILDSEGVCIRVGFHCAQPLHEYLHIGPTARASFYVYTTNSDIDALVHGLEKVKRIFK